jgi:hypothetical protein
MDCPVCVKPNHSLAARKKKRILAAALFNFANDSTQGIDSAQVRSSVIPNWEVKFQARLHRAKPQCLLRLYLGLLADPDAVNKSTVDGAKVSDDHFRAVN